MSEERVEKITNLITEIASGNYAAREEISEKRDNFDAIVLGLHMLAEELQSSVVSIEEYKKVSEARAHFIASMSHEIRTPLNAILGLAQQTLDSNLEQHQKENIEVIYNASKQLTQVIGDILDLSKLEAGSFSIETNDFNLHELIQTLVRLFEPEFQDKGLYLNIESNLSENDWRKGDGVRINQILSNLIGNAHKFTRKGGVVLSVEALDSSKVKFSVIDTGIGIGDQDKEKIFAQFTQVSSSLTTKSKGLGLGLYLAKTLVNAMSAELTMTSEYGAGSTFEFTLDLAKAKVGIKETVISEGERLAPLSILSVEDNIDNRLLMKRVLASKVKTFEEANDGAQAALMAQENKYDIILMDLQMPVMDGLTSAKLIRSEKESKNRETPMIALTAHATDDHKRSCEAAGIQYFLPKPINRDHLFKLLVEVADLKK